jgi:GMP synthase-like glutamine amidotransferase
MKIGILQTGCAPDELISEHGDYNEMFMQLLAGRGMSFATYRVLDDAFPEDATEADGWLVTGSRCGVYDGFPWISRLEAWLRHAISAQAPIVGICFGHQVITQALGGRVQKYDGGWQVGLKTYTSAETGQSRNLLAWHQDQVLALPENTVLLESSKDCRFAALQFGDTVRTYQAHPEFTPGYVQGLFEVRGDAIDPDVVRAGRESLIEEQPDDISDEIATFLTDAKARRAA